METPAFILWRDFGLSTVSHCKNWSGGCSANGSSWLGGDTSPPPPSIDLVTFVSFFSLGPLSAGWPRPARWPSRAPLTFESSDASLSLLPRGSGNGSVSSEEVHEVLSHIAVGREDPADAGGALGPRPAWWALDSVGHLLQQALTLQALGHSDSQLVVIQTSSKASPEQSAVTTIQATFGAKGPPFPQGASAGSSYTHGRAVGGAPAGG